MPGEYYDRLGVSSDASTDEIAAAYRERLKETHPDVSDASDAGERTKRLIEAKTVLTDERERGRYDRLGHDRYLRIEEGQTPESERPRREDDERGESRDGKTSPTGVDSRTSARETGEEDTDSGSGSTTDGGAGEHGTGGPGTRARRGVDWGTHTAREGRDRHSDGINWEERAEADWDAVSGWVWEDITGDDSGQSPHGATDWGNASDSDAATANSVASSTAGETGAAGAPGDTAGVGAGRQATATTGTVHDSSRTDASSNASAGTARRGDWTVGWYSGGDPSGTSHESYSFGGSDTSRGLWSTWSPGPDHHDRYSRRTFPPHRILSPAQTVVLFCLCFVTYPLLVTGAVFPIFGAPVRLGLAVFLVFVVATLIILSRLGMAIFGGWTVLFPLAFEQFGVSMFTQESLLTMGAVLFSLGLALLSRMVTQPRAL